jgi:nitroreductase / dihydropteridine reductase
MTHHLIQNLNWRYATKKYNADKKINAENLQLIKEALRLTPTSYGLQPFKFIIIENSDLRAELKKHSFNQAAITDASHLIVLATYTNIESIDIEKYMENTAQTRGLELEQLDGYSNFLKSIINNQSEEEKKTWAQKQAYIALGVLVDACAHLRIDATPIEGFLSEEYDKALNLKEQNLSATLVVPIGYRHEEDLTQHWKKVRKSEDELFITI